MSVASKLNQHLSGWRRGQAKPKPVIRTEKGKAAPRFVRCWYPPADLPSREEEARGRLLGRGMHGGAC